jgi:uncharacterized protein YndB with AHSA1/START domain
MAYIQLETEIAAPIERVFDLARGDIGFHGARWLTRGSVPSVVGREA